MIDINGVGLEVVQVPGGTYRMGDPTQPHHFPIVVQTLSAFSAGTTAITRRMWRALIDSSPWERERYRAGDDVPVTCVTRAEAISFCDRLSERNGIRASLPSDAQWEYLAQAGTSSGYFWGGDRSLAREYAVFRPEVCGSLADLHPAPVGSKKANPWGLYDMQGNVDVWVSDSYPFNPDGPYVVASSFPDHPVDFIADDGPMAVIRGGNFLLMRLSLNAHSRTLRRADAIERTLGFRIVVAQ